jgi:hypothetical protein
MKALRLAIGVVLAAGAAACSNGSSPVLPADASFDGGHTLGSGAGAPPPPPSGFAETMSSDTTGRGGHTLGGGAREQEQQTTGTSDPTARGGHTLGSGS